MMQIHFLNSCKFFSNKPNLKPERSKLLIQCHRLCRIICHLCQPSKCQFDVVAYMYCFIYLADNADKNVSLSSACLG